MANGTFDRIAETLARVEAPGELWRRVEAGLDTNIHSSQPRPRRHRVLVPVLGVVLAAVAAFAFAPGDGFGSQAVAMHRQWAERGSPLDLYSNDAAEVTGFLASQCGVTVSFKAGANTAIGSSAYASIQAPRITGVRRLGENSAMVAFQVGPVPATLLVESAAGGARKQVTSEALGGYRLYSWRRGELSYTMVSPGAETVGAACRLCHSEA